MHHIAIGFLKLLATALPMTPVRVTSSAPSGPSTVGQLQASLDNSVNENPFPELWGTTKGETLDTNTPARAAAIVKSPQVQARSEETFDVVLAAIVNKGGQVLITGVKAELATLPHSPNDSLGRVLTTLLKKPMSCAKYTIGSATPGYATRDYAFIAPERQTTPHTMNLAQFVLAFTIIATLEKQGHGMSAQKETLQKAYFASAGTLLDRLQPNKFSAAYSELISVKIALQAAKETVASGATTLAIQHARRARVRLTERMKQLETTLNALTPIVRVTSDEQSRLDRQLAPQVQEVKSQLRRQGPPSSASVAAPRRVATVVVVDPFEDIRPIKPYSEFSPSNALTPIVRVTSDEQSRLDRQLDPQVQEVKSQLRQQGQPSSTSVAAPRRVSTVVVVDPFEKIREIKPYSEFFPSATNDGGDKLGTVLNEKNTNMVDFNQYYQEPVRRAEALREYYTPSATGESDSGSSITVNDLLVLEAYRQAFIKFAAQQDTPPPPDLISEDIPKRLFATQQVLVFTVSQYFSKLKVDVSVMRSHPEEQRSPVEVKGLVAKLGTITWPREGKPPTTLSCCALGRYSKTSGINENIDLFAAIDTLRRLPMFPALALNLTGSPAILNPPYPLPVVPKPKPDPKPDPEPKPDPKPKPESVDSGTQTDPPPVVPVEENHPEDMLRKFRRVIQPDPQPVVPVEENHNEDMFRKFRRVIQPDPQPVVPEPKPDPKPAGVDSGTQTDSKKTETIETQTDSPQNPLLPPPNPVVYEQNFWKTLFEALQKRGAPVAFNMALQSSFRALNWPIIDQQRFSQAISTLTTDKNPFMVQVRDSTPDGATPESIMNTPLPAGMTINMLMQEVGDFWAQFYGQDFVNSVSGTGIARQRISGGG